MKPCSGFGQKCCPSRVVRTGLDAGSQFLVDPDEICAVVTLHLRASSTTSDKPFKSCDESGCR